MIIRPSSLPPSLSGSSSPVAVLLSGGVYSAVAAWMLRKAGREVLAVTMVIPGRGEEETEGAAAVAEFLSLPHYIAEMNREFREAVIDPFLRCYFRENAEPLRLCNERLKFACSGKSWRSSSAPSLQATGHYARVVEGTFAARGRPGRTELFSRAFPEIAPALFFPGGQKEDEVRKIARSAVFPQRERKESMDICFAREGDYRALLEGESTGSIVDEEGEILGTHRGILHHTVGQRKGLGISSREGMYVLRLDREDNRVGWAPRERAYSRIVSVEGVNLLLLGKGAEGTPLRGNAAPGGSPHPASFFP
ncbi:tRNA 2-thiouridine(34) synthase MnmA [Aminivibrio sp.]